MHVTTSPYMPRGYQAGKVDRTPLQLMFGYVPNKPLSNTWNLAELFDGPNTQFRHAWEMGGRGAFQNLSLAHDKQAVRLNKDKMVLHF